MVNGYVQWKASMGRDAAHSCCKGGLCASPLQMKPQGYCIRLMIMQPDPVLSIRLDLLIPYTSAVNSSTNFSTRMQKPTVQDP